MPAEEGVCFIRLTPHVILPLALLCGIRVNAADCKSRCANCAAPQATASPADSVGPWRLTQTANFCVCCTAANDPAAIGVACESLRRELTVKWLGEAATNNLWATKCYVVVHPSTESYLREVGAAGQGTLGSSLVRTEKGQIASRRIDIRGNVADPIHAALPHELTHVIIADAFAGEELPRWADEGMAMLADSPDKLAAHDRDLAAAISERREFRLGELFVKNEYPSGQQRATFYGQSASLVALLIARKQPSEFVQFLHRAGREGYDAALRADYGVGDVGQLERLWRSQTDIAAQKASRRGDHSPSQGT